MGDGSQTPLLPSTTSWQPPASQLCHTDPFKGDLSRADVKSVFYKSPEEARGLTTELQETMEST